MTVIAHQFRPTPEGIPDEVLADGLTFVGMSGYGKTTAAMGCANRLLASQKRVVIIDPTDVWWGLTLDREGKSRSLNIKLLGGSHGVQFTANDGQALGQAAASCKESIILSTTHLPSRSAERSFMSAFLEAFYRTVSSPVHLIADEADLLAPQKGGDQALSDRMQDIVRRGRVKGITPWLITQRPAILSKDVLSQSDGLLIFKLTSPQDQRAIGDWIDSTTGNSKPILDSLASKQKGEAVLWVPGRNILKDVTIPRNETFDSSSGPSKTTPTLKPKPLEIKEDNTLEARVRELETQVASLKRSQGSKPVKAGKKATEAMRGAYEIQIMRDFLSRH